MNNEFERWYPSERGYKDPATKKYHVYAKGYMNGMITTMTIVRSCKDMLDAIRYFTSELERVGMTNMSIFDIKERI